MTVDSNGVHRILYRTANLKCSLVMIPSYPSTPHWPASLSVHRLDRYHGRPEFFLGRDVVITEKLDGGSATICKSEVYARSSFAPTHQPWFSYMKGRTLP